MAVKIKKLLIANRGEIACRIMSTCQSLGIKTVAVYSEADAKARHVRLADESVCLGPGPASESYLVISKIIEAAKKTKAQAIHPGYGFLSERASFAQAVDKAGLIWVGPSAKTIDSMGSKIASKKIAEKAKIPTLPWALLALNASVKELAHAAKKIGYPLLLKASAGGGGRGMRLVQKESQLVELAQAAAREAEAAFGSGELFMESYRETARHVEVQILGDSHGHVVALGERDCTAQRRHQKVVEETPAPCLSEKTRKALGAAAIALGKSVGYVNAGTCEFLVDEKEKFYFLEMNTRLQVEHPVTELVWGVDLVALQLAVAQGEALPDTVHEVQPRGHAMEVRVYAEDPSQGYMPCPGKITEFSWEPGPRLRLDSGYEEGDEVPLFYDAMLAKLIAWGMDREQARQNLVQGLSRLRVGGVAWNGSFLWDVLEHEKFINFKIDTKWLERDFKSWKGPVRTEPQTVSPDTGVQTTVQAFASPWDYYGSEQGHKLALGATTENTAAHYTSPLETSWGNGSGPLVAEHPGKVLSIKVKPGDKVKQGDAVVVCESMKMEFTYSAPGDKKVKSIFVKENQIVSAGTVLVEWET